MRTIVSFAVLLAACAAESPPGPQLAPPDNFQALYRPDSVELSWNPVVNATGYLLYASSSASPRRGERIARAARPSSPHQFLPAFTLEIRPRSAHLHWDTNRYGDSAVVSRSPLPGTFITVANASGGDFDDLGLEPNATTGS